MQTGIGATSRMVTDDSEIFRLDNLESEVAGRACSSSRLCIATFVQSSSSRKAHSE